MKKRIFIDARQGQRCEATITLADKSTAQCGRSCKAGNAHFCFQHAPKEGLDLTKTEREILNHRLTAPESICEALEGPALEEVESICELLEGGQYDLCMKLNPQLTADVLQDAVDGSTYLGHANHESRQWESAMIRAGHSLASKVGTFIGRDVEFAG